jgi:hypothetical protein
LWWSKLSTIEPLQYNLFIYIVYFCLSLWSSLQYLIVYIKCLFYWKKNPTTSKPLLSTMVDSLCFLYLFMYTGAQHDFYVRWCWCRWTVTQRVSLVEQGLLTLPEHLRPMVLWLKVWIITRHRNKEDTVTSVRKCCIANTTNHKSYTLLLISY